jgi:hypothetical protein
MEAICSSETSVDTQWTTWRYIPEDGTLQSSFYLKIVAHKNILNINFIMTQCLIEMLNLKTPW